MAISVTRQLFSTLSFFLILSFDQVCTTRRHIHTTNAITGARGVGSAFSCSLFSYFFLSFFLFHLVEPIHLCLVSVSGKGDVMGGLLFFFSTHTNVFLPSFQTRTFCAAATFKTNNRRQRYTAKLRSYM